MSALQLMATAIGYLMPDRLSSSVLTTVAVLVSGVVSGIPLNFSDLKKVPGIRILSTLSPTRYLMLPMLQNDHDYKILETLAKNHECHNKRVRNIIDLFSLNDFSLMILFLIFSDSTSGYHSSTTVFCPQWYCCSNASWSFVTSS